MRRVCAATAGWEHLVVGIGGVPGTKCVGDALKAQMLWPPVTTTDGNGRNDRKQGRKGKELLVFGVGTNTETTH